jgi:hypothetical protein
VAWSYDRTQLDRSIEAGLQVELIFVLKRDGCYEGSWIADWLTESWDLSERGVGALETHMYVEEG